MAIRTSDSDISAIIEWDETVALTAFIRAASLVTDRIAACAIEKGETLTDDELREIEAWLAAHFYTHRDREYTSKSTLNASGSFKMDSSFLDVAKLLDHSGCLAALVAEEGRAIARGFWLGKRPSEQSDYSQRY